MIAAEPAPDRPQPVPTPRDLAAGDAWARARPVLRLWALLDGVYALLVAALAIWAVPWKTPAVNLAALLWAFALAAGAPFLAQGRRFAHRLAVATSLLGLAGAVLAVAGLVASWAYLRAAYGAFGAGASLASLLVAGLVFQVLGLYPAIRLRALLRAEVRSAMRAGRAAAIAAAAMAALPLVVGVGVHVAYALAPIDPLPAEIARATLTNLRAALTGASATPAALRGVPLGPGPLVATLYDEGRIVARAAATGADLAAAVEALAPQLRDAAARQGFTDRGRLKIDRVAARGPVLRSPALALSLGLAPGLDGLIDAADRPVFLPDDVIQAGVAGASAPMPALSELRLGIDAGWIETRIAQAGARAPLSRVRTEGWIETPAGVAQVHRGNVIAPVPSAAAAALAGGDYLLRQMESDGRFRYRYQPLTDQGGAGDEYSLARHAGTAYGLAILYASTGQARFREASEGALAWLARQIGPTCGKTAGRLCLIEDGRVAFGPSALAAIAMFEHQRRTGDRRYQETALGLAAFLVDRQRADGEFDHWFDVATGAVVAGPPRLFASEQAALALVLAHRVAGRADALPAAERALDFLTRKKYDFPLGRFIYGADHWTCIAAEEAWPALKHRHYVDFCRGYADFMRRLQYRAPADARRRPLATPDWDFAGHYGFGHQLVPQAPATAGFTEALLSTLALSRHHGLPSDALAADARQALAALAREQLGPDNSYLAPRPERAAGGFRRSLVEPEIRIDFVQHAATALARAPGLGITAL